MRPCAWAWSLLAAGLVLSFSPTSSASPRHSRSAWVHGGGLSLRFRSGGISARLQVFARYSRARGGYYPGGYGYYVPRRIYPPNYYGGYFSVYPAFGYGYPYDDFPIYDFPVYAGLPLVPVGFFSPNWPGWYAPVYLWPRLYSGGPAIAPPAPLVEVLPPRVQEAPVPYESPTGPKEGEAPPESGLVPERPAVPAAPEGGKARVEKRPGSPQRTVRMGRFQVDWSKGARTEVRWTGDPRVIGELRVEELDAARRRITERRIDAYPFRTTFERDPKTAFLLVNARAGDEILATALFPVKEKARVNHQDTK